ncbi:hypothetical protein [Actinomadura macrotermitis]|nr:hypothetical protein [Actinomadura macrotermitis]
MTTTVFTPLGSAGPGRFRVAVCAATIAACVPYLVLKIAWLSGSTVGWNDAAAARGSALAVGNAVTMGMDAVAVGAALAFTFAWGRRLPAWLVVVPIWFGTGLLAPIVLGVPLGTVLQALIDGTAPVRGSAGGLQGWVYAMVYGGFTCQGLGLLTAFVPYARLRWADVFALRTADVPRGATHAVQAFLAHAAAVPTLAYAALQLVWACGGTAGQPAGEGMNITQRTVAGAYGLLALAGAAGLLAIVHRRGGRLYVPVLAAWTGAGATFAWSLYMLIITVGTPDFLDARSTPLTGLALLCGVLGGLVTGLAGAFFLAERQSARPTASSTP